MVEKHVVDRGAVGRQALDVVLNCLDSGVVGREQGKAAVALIEGVEERDVGGLVIRRVIER